MLRAGRLFFFRCPERPASAILRDGVVDKKSQPDTDVAVAPQLVEADFAEIATRGFRSVVNIRPDGEAPDQLPQAQAAAAARRHGLTYRYLPVKNLNATDDHIVGGFARLMDELPGPILFYCGTSTRCTVLWTQAAASRLGVDAVLSIARKAGYDFAFLRETLAERSGWLGAVAASPSPSTLSTTAGG